MALRLTDPSAAPAPSGGHSLQARADAALRAGDVEAYNALFAQAAGLADRNERYAARCDLLEAGLGGAASVPKSVLARLFLAIARAGVEILEDDPREPVLLNYTGVALYELGALRAAEQLFKAVRRLDPELPHVAANLAAVRARRRTGRELAGLPAGVAAALLGLGLRAEVCARRARPARGLTLSLCMIVKDEEDMLPRCLEAARPAVDEIVVVDTGSSDRTVEIARSFGAQVIDHPWTGSFAEARNVSFEAATGDWIIYLDADEVLVAADAGRLRELTGRVWREAFFLVETNYTGHEDDGTGTTHNALRVFRNRPEYRFEGRLHEQVAHRLPGRPERVEATSIRLEHYGYLGAVRGAKDKSRRNIELLERQAREGDDTPFQAYNLGSEYAAIGETERALQQFRKAWDTLRSTGELGIRVFAPSLASRLVTTLRAAGRLDDADRHAQEALAAFPGFTDLVFEQAFVARDRGDRDQAIALLERCLDLGEAPARYTSTLGCGTFLALQALADLHRAAGNLAEAECILSRCLTEHPRFLGAVLPFAEVLLARGADPEAVVTAIESSLETVTASARFMLGTALYERGFVAAAEVQFREVLRRQPSSTPARAALAETLLSQRDYAQAAELAEALARELPTGPAWRTEAFARLAGGDFEAAAATLARARAAGVPAHEVAVFAAWLSPVGGDDAAEPIPAAGAALLTVTLEALLRVEEIEAFAQLVSAVDRLAVTWRERRELLAGVYLRRGFLESAADEWLAVCDREGPDARALSGLAQVAAAQGMTDDAQLFAREAQLLA